MKNLGLKNVLLEVVDKELVPDVQFKVNVLALALPTGNG